MKWQPGLETGLPESAQIGEGDREFVVVTQVRGLKRDRRAPSRDIRHRVAGGAGNGSTCGHDCGRGADDRGAP